MSTTTTKSTTKTTTKIPSEEQTASELLALLNPAFKGLVLKIEQMSGLVKISQGEARKAGKLVTELKEEITSLKVEVKEVKELKKEIEDLRKLLVKFMSGQPIQTSAETTVSAPEKEPSTAELEAMVSPLLEESASEKPGSFKTACTDSVKTVKIKVSARASRPWTPVREKKIITSISDTERTDLRDAMSAVTELLSPKKTADAVFEVQTEFSITGTELDNFGRTNSQLVKLSSMGEELEHGINFSIKDKVAIKVGDQLKLFEWSPVCKAVNKSNIRAFVPRVWQVSKKRFNEVQEKVTNFIGIFENVLKTQPWYEKSSKGDSKQHFTKIALFAQKLIKIGSGHLLNFYFKKDGIYLNIDYYYEYPSSMLHVIGKDTLAFSKKSKTEDAISMYGDKAALILSTLETDLKAKY